MAPWFKNIEFLLALEKWQNRDGQEEILQKVGEEKVEKGEKVANNLKTIHKFKS